MKEMQEKTTATAITNFAQDDMSCIMLSGGKNQKQEISQSPYYYYYYYLRELYLMGARGLHFIRYGSRSVVK